MIRKLIRLFKPTGLNRNYLQMKEYRIDIAQQLKLKRELSKNFSNKGWRKNTKLLAEAKKYL